MKIKDFKFNSVAGLAIQVASNSLSGSANEAFVWLAWVLFICQNSPL
ncbi:MAG: hypothetical protein Q8L97_07440 [Nitrosomonas sp.]|nr:hypothetical protein [Nitrosomonas sp.]MDP1549978.1 hypothetical protein [Nitrosomonas sp.]